MVERKKIKATRETYFHLLRHFTEITEKEIGYFLNESYSLNQINEQLKISGSKFYPAFSDGPYDLISNLNLFKEKTSFLQDTNTLIFIWDFLELGFTEPIGFDGLVNRNDLDETESQMVYKTIRANYEVFQLATDKIKNTSSLVMSCIETEESFLLRTCFPGTYAPPFPSENLPNELNIKAIQFWKEHVLIVYQSNLNVK